MALDAVSSLEARSLWYVAPGQVDLRTASLPLPGAEEVLVRSLYSGISRGTERLIFEGRVPPSEFGRMRLPTQEGEFSFPVKYGYAAVGIVEAGPTDLKGRTIFALHPHQDWFVVNSGAAIPVPEAVPPRRAVLAANLETALNALWDGEIAPCDRVAVVGGGLIGLLAATLATGLPGTEVTLIDKDPTRAEIAKRLGVRFAEPDAAPQDADLVIHASTSEAGLALAFDLAGTEATIVEASWFGARPVTIPLGGAFHSRRLRLVSSQVGAVPSRRRARWTPQRRMEAVMRLLADDRFDALLGEEVAFADLPRELPRLLAPDAPGVGALVRY